MGFFNDFYEKSLAKNIFATFASFFLLQFIIGAIIIYSVIIGQTKQYLQQTSQRVSEDIIYTNGAWDIRRYNADPNLPDTYPLYIFSADGYVIDRWKPIHGLLDTSDVKHLLLYQQPQTISAPTNQSWRIVSAPYQYKNQTLGIITASYINPSASNTAAIDTKLLQAIDIIRSKITVKNNNIDTSNLDPRDVSYDIAFQVSDKFNRIILKNNNNNSIDRIPNYIDTSYVRDAVNNSGVKQIYDKTNGQTFLLVTKPLYDADHNILGVIVIGKAITYLYTILNQYLFYQTLFGLTLFIFICLLTIRLRNIYRRKTESIVPKPKIRKISFLKNESILQIDETKIPIAYASNQYYLCEAVFTHPQRRWETDELLEMFGEEIIGVNWRKVYDAMAMVNKKASSILGTKLIINRDKTYQLNPDLASKAV
jgi:hypothetical protein